MDSQMIKNRTKNFAVRVIKLINALPNNTAGKVISYQLGKSGTSVGANYRASCRARSDKEFIAKLGVVLEEADESAFWLELIIESELLSESLVRPLQKEADELCAIFYSSIRSAKSQ